MIVFKGILRIKTCNIHPGRRKDVDFFENVSDCHFETFGYISCLVSGNTLLASDFFAKKLPLIFAECSVKCHQCVICRHNGMGMGAIFQDFTRCILTLKGGGQKSANKKGKESAPANKKIKVNFVLGILAQDYKNPNKTVTMIRCDVSKYEIRVLMTKQYTTLVVKKKRVGELLLCIVSMLS